MRKIELISHRLLTAAVLVLLAAAIFRIHRLTNVLHELTDRENALIELNHDKSEYIDGGCNGEYQGSEENLPPVAEN